MEKIKYSQSEKSSEVTTADKVDPILASCRHNITDFMQNVRYYVTKFYDKTLILDFFKLSPTENSPGLYMADLEIN